MTDHSATESDAGPATENEIRTFSWIDEAIPRYQSFFSVEEHRHRNIELADEYNHVTYEEHGESAGGERIWSITVGSGSDSALLLGAPHPNEPIGSMTIDYLVHELARNEELRHALDYEFVCLPVSDPDGVRKNEGWFDGPYTPSNYAQNFYRPPPHRQIEATFPIEYEGYSFEQPTPATSAIADLIKSHQPAFIYSLHNADFGGCYYLLTEPLADIHETLTSLPGEYGVPLDRGEPEWFKRTAFDDAISRLETFEDRYENVDTTAADVTSKLLGGNAYDYARQFREDVIEFVVELPYFHAFQIEDQTTRERSRAAVIQAGVEHRQELLREWEAAARAATDLLPETPMALEGTGTVSHFKQEDAAKCDWAHAAEETDRRATTAEYVDERFIKQYYQLRYLGMFLRALDNAAMEADEASRNRLVSTKRALTEILHERLGEIQSQVAYEVIPIWKLVAIQARAGLIAMEYRQKQKPL